MAKRRHLTDTRRHTYEITIEAIEMLKKYKKQSTVNMSYAVDMAIKMYLRQRM